MNVITHNLVHMWQENPELEYILDLPAKQRCGLACMTMQLHYYGMPIPADEVLKEARQFKAINANGDWWHPGQVKLLKRYGLVAWRRNWHFSPSGAPPEEHFRTQEGYDERQLNAFKWQRAAEEPYTLPEAKFLHSLQMSLLAGDPVIVSVKKEFSHNKQNHQIVVSGWNEAELTYMVYDPIQPIGPAAVHESYLLEYSNLWAIFTQQG